MANWVSVENQSLKILRKSEWTKLSKSGDLVVHEDQIDQIGNGLTQTFEFLDSVVVDHQCLET